MSYTNQTQHYGLPQYVGTDVPAWLTDINQAFAAIDTGMNSAKTQADSAATSAGQAANDVAALASTVSAQSAQISAAAQAASAAQTTANTADGKADTNATNISGLDTRVTALEQGGTGGAGLDYVDVVKGSSYYIDLEGSLPVGAIPVCALWLTGTVSGVGAITQIFAPTNRVLCWQVTNAGAVQGLTAAGTVRVFYMNP